MDSLLSAGKTKMENNNRYIVVCASLYSIQHCHAESYIFRLVHLGRKEMKLNNEYL